MRDDWLLLVLSIARITVALLVLKYTRSSSLSSILSDLNYLKHHTQRVHLITTEMSRYNSSYDTDEYLLPEGFKRTGYDADTQEYFFTSGDGIIYKSLPGNRYGKLIPVASDINQRSTTQDQDSGDFVSPFAQEPVADVDDGNKKAWRSMLPFFVLVGLVLLLVIKAVSIGPQNLLGSHVEVCGDGSIAHVIHAGETCWNLSKKYQTSIDVLKNMNDNLDCASLQIGRKICVPFADKE